MNGLEFWQRNLPPHGQSSDKFRGCNLGYDNFSKEEENFINLTVNLLQEHGSTCTRITIG